MFPFSKIQSISYLFRHIFFVTSEISRLCNTSSISLCTRDSNGILESCVRMRVSKLMRTIVRNDPILTRFVLTLNRWFEIYVCGYRYVVFMDIAWSTKRTGFELALWMWLCECNRVSVCAQWQIYCYSNWGISQSYKVIDNNTVTLLYIILNIY